LAAVAAHARLSDLPNTRAAAARDNSPVPQLA